MKSRNIIGTLLLLAVSAVLLFYGTAQGAALGMTLPTAGILVVGMWVAVWIMPHGHRCTCDRCSTTEKCNCKPGCDCTKGACTC